MEPSLNAAFILGLELSGFEQQKTPEGRTGVFVSVFRNLQGTKDLEKIWNRSLADDLSRGGGGTGR
jgi:hypothetical protein